MKLPIIIFKFTLIILLVFFTWLILHFWPYLAFFIFLFALFLPLISRFKIIKLPKFITGPRLILINTFFLLLSLLLLYFEPIILSKKEPQVDNRNIILTYHMHPPLNNGLIPVDINIENITLSINAVQLHINYDPKNFEIISSNESDSFADYFIDKKITNSDGHFFLVGGLTNPGYSLSSAKFTTLYLKMIKPQTPSFRLSPFSKVMTNSAQPFNLLDPDQAKILPSTIEIISSDPSPKHYLYDQDSIHISGREFVTPPASYFIKFSNCYDFLYQFDRKILNPIFAKSRK